MRPSPVLCTRSPTPATVLVVAGHATPATCTPWDKQTRFSKRNKDKRKIKQNYSEFEFKPRQVNDSSQSNQVTVYLVSQSPPLMSPLTTKAQSFKFESKIPWSTARTPKKTRKAQEGHLEEGKSQKPTKSKKSGKAKQNGTEELERAQRSKKRSKSTQKLKRARKAQKLHKSSKSTLPLKSTPPNPLNASSPS
jgi:hypothetical protein